MAYNNFYPASYQPYQYQQYPNFQQPMQPVSQMNNFQNGNSMQPQIQNGGFVTVRNLQEAFNYPVAPGNSVTFKDDNAPYIYVKTKGFSQLEEPVFEKFRLVKEEETPSQNAQAASAGVSNEQAINYSDFAKVADLTALWSEIEVIKKQIADINAIPERKIKKREVDADV